MKEKELVLELMRIALDLSTDGFHVFVRFSPHTNQVDIDVHANGWDSNRDPDMSEYIYIDNRYYDSKLLLKKAIQKIKRLHKKHSKKVA